MSVSTKSINLPLVDKLLEFVNNDPSVSLPLLGFLETIKMKLNKTLLSTGAVVALTISMFVSVYMVQQQTPGDNASAAVVPSTVYFSPESQTLPSNGPVSVFVDASTNQLVFARVTLQFDPKVLELSREIDVTSKLTRVIEVTPMATANTNGKVTIVVGLSEENRTTPPTGVIQVGQLYFSSKTQTNATTQVTLVDSDVQLVAASAEKISMSSKPLTFTLNPTNTPTSTKTPTPTSTPSATPTIVTTISPTISPINTVTPTQTPSQTLGSRIVVYAAGTRAGGAYPRMDIHVKNGNSFRRVTRFTNIQGDPFNSRFVELVYNHPQKLTINDLRFYYSNDFWNYFTGADRDLMIEKVVLDGVTYSPLSEDTYSTGSWNSETDCAPGYKRSQWLNCNGFFYFGK